MPRVAKCRFVEVMPTARVFTPVGVPQSCPDEVVLKIEEVEAIRLKNYLGLEQEECADKMQISRPTFQRIINDAQAKIADALVHGKSIRIEGGNYCLGHGYCRRLGRDLQSTDECSFMDNLPVKDTIDQIDHASIQKVAVTTSGNALDDKIDVRFGRCRQFILFDIRSNSYSVIENTNIGEGHGIGIGAAQEVINSGADVVITSRIGPKAFAILQRAGIPVFLANGEASVGVNIEQLEQNMLTRLHHANN